VVPVLGRDAPRKHVLRDFVSVVQNLKPPQKLLADTGTSATKTGLLDTNLRHEQQPLLAAAETCLKSPHARIPFAGRF
jgi:hypothetical protein